MYEKEKELVVRTARNLFDSGFVLPLEGNISLRIPGEGRMIITPTANRYDDLEIDDMVVMDFDGTIDESCSGSRKPSSEFRFHAAVLKARPRANGVIHAHPQESVAHAVLGWEIPPIVEEMAILLGGSVPCAHYARTGTFDLVEAILAGLGSGNAVLLAHHGLLACGRSLEAARDTIQVVEKLAGIHRKARSLAGGPVPELPEADKKALKSKFLEWFATS